MSRSRPSATDRTVIVHGLADAWLTRCLLEAGLVPSHPDGTVTVWTAPEATADEASARVSGMGQD